MLTRNVSHLPNPPTRFPHSALNSVPAVPPPPGPCMNCRRSCTGTVGSCVDASGAPLLAAPPVTSRSSPRRGTTPFTGGLSAYPPPPPPKPPPETPDPPPCICAFRRTPAAVCTAAYASLSGVGWKTPPLRYAALWHPKHTRCGVVNPSFGRNTLLGEHFLQNTNPQWRQWCFRLNKVNCVAHPKQAGEARSSAHGGLYKTPTGVEKTGDKNSSPPVHGAPAGRADEYMLAVLFTVSGTSSVRLRDGPGNAKVTRTPYVHRTETPAVLAGQPGGVRYK
mmetsp:Transcript_8843/g.29477  ORF Transcript_8843/g.29477 Transcript_8843/m.29477 type:complete len:278 (+) Transcript_8843:27-860(+)